MNPNPLALNLYTVRDECEKDLPGTLMRIAAIGFKVVELGDTYGLSPEAARAALDAAGLSVCGLHAAIEELETDCDSLLDRCRIFDCTYLTCVWIPEPRRDSAEGWRREARNLNYIGARCAERGVQLGFHNHSYEFETFDGACGLDILFDNSDPELLKAEIDVYWVQHGGADPVAYIDKYAGRCPLIHLKDMAADRKQSFAEAGKGILDFPAIREAGQRAGVEWYISEQDTCTTPTLQSAAESYRYLTSIGH